MHKFILEPHEQAKVLEDCTKAYKELPSFGRPAFNMWLYDHMCIEQLKKVKAEYDNIQKGPCPKLGCQDWSCAECKAFYFLSSLESELHNLS